MNFKNLKRRDTMLPISAYCCWSGVKVNGEKHEEGMVKRTEEGEGLKG